MTEDKAYTIQAKMYIHFGKLWLKEKLFINPNGYNSSVVTKTNPYADDYKFDIVIDFNYLCDEYKKKYDSLDCWDHVREYINTTFPVDYVNINLEIR